MTEPLHGFPHKLGPRPTYPDPRTADRWFWGGLVVGLAIIARKVWKP